MLARLRGSSLGLGFSVIVLFVCHENLLILCGDMKERWLQ
jgi:hypothetical protein